MATEAEKTIKVITGIDAARRVGWAKAFAEAERADQASREANLFREGRDHYRSGLSFMFGLFLEWTGSDHSQMFQQVLSSVTDYEAVLDSEQVKAGRRKAQSIRQADAVYREERDLAKAAKGKRQRDGEQAYKNARQLALVDMAAGYGFDSIEAMRGVLAKWQNATGRPSLDRREVRRKIRREQREEIA